MLCFFECSRFLQAFIKQMLRVAFTDGGTEHDVAPSCRAAAASRGASLDGDGDGSSGTASFAAATEHADAPVPSAVMVLGCGAYRIGSSCEFE
jgi:hypothetical protein